MKLTNREEQIMNYLWVNGKSFVKDIISSFDNPKPHYNTISTIVRNLEQKGYINHEDFGSTFRYFTTVSKEEFVKNNVRQQVKKYFNNSYTALISSLVESDDLSIEEIKELIDLAKNK
ncbi:MAG: BlaI/MecI/CopY family transcriptional regulator [Paludibacter sp.]|nr:BlaI/MecI/CopY family transcriptional regulator [Paludibacter sp.]MDD4428304.1 BlaI/MecI/CopY family transcriptional regulator [Paludibacter sp.]